MPMIVESLFTVEKLCILAYLTVGFALGVLMRWWPNISAIKSLDCNTSKVEDYVPAKPVNIPRHIGVIMDGNRRYGRQQHSDPLKVS